MVGTGRRVLLAAWLLVAAGCRDADQRGLTVQEVGQFAGPWVSDTLPTEVGRGRVARLNVRPDTAAVLSMEYVGRGSVNLPGHWSARGTELTFQPVDIDFRPNARPFIWRLERDRLVPVRWDKGLYGETGVPLRRWVPQDSTAADTATQEAVR